MFSFPFFWWLRLLKVSLSFPWPFEFFLLRIKSQFLIGLFALFNFLSSLWIFNIRSLSCVGVVKILSLNVGYHFVLLTVSFALQKPCSFISFHLSICHLRSWVIGVLFRKLSPVPIHSMVLPNFFSMWFSVSGLCWGPSSTWMWIFCRMVSMNLLSFF